MGLFVDDNGHYRGWLASVLCCCAAMTEDEYPAARQKDKSALSSKESASYQQPALSELPSLPNTARVSPIDKIDSDAGSLHDSRHSDTFNLSKALHFDSDSLLPQLATNEIHNTNSQLPQSTPNDASQTIRRVRPSPSGSLHRQNLVPLPLGPVILRDTHDTTTQATTTRPAGTRSSPDTRRQHQRSESTQDLLSNPPRQQPYLETRETPFQRCGRQSTETLMARTSPTKPPPQTYRPSTTPKTTASTPSLSTSLRHHALQPSSSTSSAHSAHSSTTTDRPRTSSRLQRKRSKSSFSGHNNDDSDVEKEVLELNTIVEERRAETNKALRLRNSHHVPAVAPSMQVGARSQTLDDIGSVLSRPLQNHSVKHSTEATDIRSSKSPKSTSRVSGWLLSDVTARSDATRTTDGDDDEPFYKCAPGHAAGSVSSSVTALDSVSYTLESSSSKRTSRRYSRSLMVTPLAPVEDFEGGERMVGVAL